MSAVMDRQLTKRQFGARLRELRRAAGLSQEALASRLGMPQNSFSNWERGIASPGIEMTDEIARAIGCNPSELSKPPASIPKIKKGRPFDDKPDDNE